jgi:D-alanine-D-alanine ligase
LRVAILHNSDALGPPADPVLEQVQEALRAERHEPRLVVLNDSVEPVIAALSAEPTDIVFNMTEGFNGKSSLDSSVASLLNLLNQRYTGSSPAGLMLAGDKSLTKKVLSFHGIRSPEFATVYRGALDHAGELSFPLIVKPPQEDASLGITTSSVVNDVGELLRRIGELHEQYQAPVLVEEFIVGREFYVGVLGNFDLQPLPIIELDFTGFPEHLPRVASYAAKWGDATGEGQGAEFAGTKSVFPEGLDEELTKKMQQTAVEAFRALRLRDYARIDLRVNDNGDVFVIEVNPNCYLERNAEFATAAARADIPYETLIARIVELASARYAR